MKITRSDYIIISKAILRKLYITGCWGKGSLYEEHLKDGFPQNEKGKVLIVADALVRQGLICKKRKIYGFKFFLNPEKRDKIREILKISVSK